VFVDTLRVNGHTSVAGPHTPHLKINKTDVLYAGVPVVTAPGRSMAARVAASILLAAKMRTVARNEEDYSQLLLRLLRKGGVLRSEGGGWGAGGG
jgi:hypothetical protein